MEEEEFAKNTTVFLSDDTCSKEDIILTTQHTNKDGNKNYLCNIQLGNTEKQNDLRSAKKLSEITLKYINCRLRDPENQKCLHRLFSIKTSNNKQMEQMATNNRFFNEIIIDTASRFGLEKVKSVEETLNFPITNIKNTTALDKTSKDLNSQDTNKDDENIEVSEEDSLLENHENNITEGHLDLNSNTNYEETVMLEASKETATINLELITEDSVDSNEVLDQILNKHLILRVSKKDEKHREITKEGSIIEENIITRTEVYSDANNGFEINTKTNKRKEANKCLFTKEDSEDVSEVLNQMLDKHLTMQGEDIQITKLYSQNKLEKSMDNKVTKKSIDAKEVLDQIFKLPQRITKRKRRKFDKSIIVKNDTPIVTINIIFNSDTNNYEMEQKLSYANTEESQVSTSNSINSTDSEDESLEKYLKFHKRPVRDSESDAETDEEEQSDCEDNDDKVDKWPVMEPGEISLKSLKGLHTDEVRKEMDEESPSPKFISQILEDSNSVIPGFKDRVKVCKHSSKNFHTPYDLCTHDCTKKPVLDFSELNETLKKSRLVNPDPKPFKKDVNISQNHAGESNNLNKETKKQDEESNQIPYIRRGVDAKPVPCPICKKIFSRRSGLQIHLRRHKKEKPYHCEYCKKGFVTLYDLDRHMVTHVGQKRNRLMCEVCAKPFVSKAGLIQHKKIAHRFYTYVCDICEMPFNGEGLLNKHLEEHEEADAIDESLEILESIEAENWALLKTQAEIKNTNVDKSKPVTPSESSNEIDLNNESNFKETSKLVPLEEIELDMIHPGIETQVSQLIETIASDIATPNIAVSPQHESNKNSEDKELDAECKTKLDFEKSMQHIPLNDIKGVRDPLTGKYIQNQSPVLINLNQIQSSVPSTLNGTSLIKIKQKMIKNACEMINLKDIADESLKIIPAQQIKLIDFNRSMVIENETLTSTNMNEPTRTAQIIPSSQVEIEFINLKQSSEDSFVTSETMNEHDVNETIKQLSFVRSKDTAMDSEIVTSTVDESGPVNGTVLVDENMPVAMEVSEVLVREEIEIVDFDVNETSVIDETVEIKNNLGTIEAKQSYDTASDQEVEQTTKRSTFVVKQPKKQEQQFYDEFEEDKCTNDQILLKEALEEITNTNALIQEAEKLAAENLSGDSDSYFLNGKIELLNVMSPSAVSDMDEDLNCSESDGVLP